MEFWRENRLDQRFEMPVAEVADKFLTWAIAQPGWQEARLSGLIEAKGMNLERILRWWLTDPAGLNSVWDEQHGEESFGALYLIVRDRLR